MYINARHQGCAAAYKCAAERRVRGNTDARKYTGARHHGCAETRVRGTYECAAAWRVRGSIRMRGHTDARQHTRLRGTIADSDVNEVATNETTRSCNP